MADRRPDVFPLAMRQRLGTRQPRKARPGEEAQDEADVERRGAEQRQDEQRDEEARQHLDELGKPHQGIVDHAAEETRRNADDEADRRPTIAAVMTPTMSEVRAPVTTPEKRSRPRSSVPKRCGRLGGLKAGPTLANGS